MMNVPQTSFEAENGLRDFALMGESHHFSLKPFKLLFSNPSFVGKRGNVDGKGKLSSRDSCASEGGKLCPISLRGKTLPQKMFSAFGAGQKGSYANGVGRI